MPNYFEISPTNDALSLQQGKGSAGFTVRYVGERPVEAKAEAVALQGADQGWLQVAQPTTKEMQSNQTQTFKVLVNVPSGTPAGRYGLRLDVMSVDNTDEEYNQGPVVAFEVGENSAAPPKQKGFPWWVVIVSVVVLAMVAGGVTWWVMHRSKTTQINFSEAAAGIIAADAYLEEGISVVETKSKRSISVADLRKIKPTDRFHVSGRGISPTLAANLKPVGTYCADALPAILPAGSYRLPESVLSTASPGNLNKCNGVELSFKLQRPASRVSVSFFGAKVEYQLRAYDRDGNEVGSDTASATPYDYGTPSTVEVSSEDALIDRFEFGHQTALTMIKSIEITTVGRE